MKSSLPEKLANFQLVPIPVCTYAVLDIYNSDDRVTRPVRQIWHKTNKSLIGGALFRLALHREIEFQLNVYVVWIGHNILKGQ